MRNESWMELKCCFWWHFNKKKWTKNPTTMFHIFLLSRILLMFSIRKSRFIGVFSALGVLWDENQNSLDNYTIDFSVQSETTIATGVCSRVESHNWLATHRCVFEIAFDYSAQFPDKSALALTGISYSDLQRKNNWHETWAENLICFRSEYKKNPLQEFSEP